MQAIGLYYITNPYSERSHLQQVQLALEAGVRWIQLRMKDLTDAKSLEIAIQSQKLCRSKGCKLIINDNPELALESQADGVHLGKNDMSVSEAKSLMGSRSIIGGTCNSLEDILEQVKQGASYIGLGPYRFTETKKNLSPVLGIGGYQSILTHLNKMGVQIPIVGIGGITESDIPSLMGTGLSGIAISSAISDADQPVQEAMKLITITNQSINPKYGNITDSR